MSATHPGQAIPDDDLAAHAAALYPDDPALQLAWVRGVRLVRTTARGWVLDPLPLPPARATMRARNPEQAPTWQTIRAATPNSPSTSTE